MVDKYTWVDIGSSYLPGEIIAAFLYAQLEEIDSILEKRKQVWTWYHAALEPLEKEGKLKRPIYEIDKHNGHIYYVILKTETERNTLMNHLKENGITSVFHYIPLHSSPAGLKYGRIGSEMKETNRISTCLLRLPLFVEMTEEDVDRVESSLVL
jgi:dTDP-4-amino-4,6-dideoxygalactose transaminase